MDRRAASGFYAALGVRFISGAFIGHIGHLGLIDLIQRARYLGELSPEPRVFVGRKESVANQAYLECWRDHVDIHYLDLDEYRSFEKLMRPLFEDISIVRLRDALPHFYHAYASVNERWSREGRSALISFDPASVEFGRSVFERHGLDRNGWFVGLHVREGDPFPWTNAVDSDIVTYVPAIRAIIAAGGTVVRIGSSNMRRLPEMKGLIDYASADWKSPELDVYVWSQCRFFIGTGSGPLNIPPTFGRPSILTNYPSIAFDQGFSDHLVLPKRVLRRDGSQVAFDEVLGSPFGYSVSRIHQDYDWRFEDNSPGEIEEACLEMIELTREEGGFSRLRASQDDSLAALQTRGRTGRTPFPASFVNQHPGLFD
jgi:putative glycosyltransferase (TIGR04372 family)